MHQLAESMVLSRSAATRFIDRMESAGLVERIQCLTDGRGTFVQLSPGGRKRLDRARPIHTRVIEEHFASQVSSHELATVQRVMTRLAGADQAGESVTVTT